MCYNQLLGNLCRRSKNALAATNSLLANAAKHENQPDMCNQEKGKGQSEDRKGGSLAPFYMP